VCVYIYIYLYTVAHILKWVRYLTLTSKASQNILKYDVKTERKNICLLKVKETHVAMRLLFMVISEKLGFGMLKQVESICFYSDVFLCAHTVYSRI